MLGFIMAVITFFRRIKVKIDENSLRYAKRRSEVQQRINKKFSGGRETLEDKQRRTQELNSKTKNPTRERIKDTLIYGASFVLSVIETLPLLVGALTWSALMILLIIVMLILFSFMEMLRNLIGLENDCLPPKEVQAQESDSTGGKSLEGGLLAWTKEELQAKGGKLSDFDKNAYRMGILSREAFEKTYGFDGTYAGNRDVYKLTLMSLGLVSIESSFVLTSGGKGNIFEDRVVNSINSSNYGFMGLHKNGSMGDKSHPVPKEAVSKIKQVYKPKFSMVSNLEYAPYAMNMSIAHLKTKYNWAVVSYAKNDIEKRLKAWGFKGEEAQYLREYLSSILAQGAYLSWQSGKHVEAIDTALAVYWASGDSPDTRSFLNYSFSIGGYDESSKRYSWIGSRGALKKANTKYYGTLNGKKLNTDILSYAYKKAPDKMKSAIEKANSTVTAYLSLGTGNTKGQFFYYGLHSIVIAGKLERDLAKKMGISTKTTPTGVKEDKDKKAEEENEELKEKKEKEKKKSTASITNDSKILKVSNEVDNSDKMKQGGIWVIVNKSPENRLSKDFVPKDLVLPNVPRKDDSQTKMTKEASKNLESMFASAKKSKIELGAFSGYRSYATQEATFRNHVKNQGSEEKAIKISAPAGASEHQTGLTMDIVAKKNVNGSSSVYLVKEFGDTKEGKWLASNSHKFGFILRYPQGKEKITTYSYEPWHFRYVGKELATKIKEKNITLEEAKKQGLMGKSDTTATKQKQITKDTKFFYVGDSITESVKPLLQKEFKNIVVDSKVGRQMSEAKPILEEQAKEKSYGEAVVIALGTNGKFKESLLKTYIELFPKDTPIALVNTYFKRDWMDDVNKTLASVAKKYDNVTLIDWNSQGKPEYHVKDGVHLNAKGQKAYTKYVSEQLKAIKYGKVEEEKKEEATTSNTGGSQDCGDEEPKKEVKKEEEDESLVIGNFKETPGKGQAVTLKGETTEQLAKKKGLGYLSAWQKSFGTSMHLRGKLPSMKNYKDPDFGVPFYFQGINSPELYTYNNWSNKTGAYTKGLKSSMGETGCMIFVQAYVLSAFTGKLVNPSEAFMILAINGNIEKGGLVQHEMSNMYAQYGIKSKLLYSHFNYSHKGIIVSELKKKHPVMFRTKGPTYAWGGHFLVLTSYHKVKGKEYFRMYTSAWANQTRDLQPAGAVLAEGHSQGVSFAKAK